MLCSCQSNLCSKSLLITSPAWSTKPWRANRADVTIHANRHHFSIIWQFKKKLTHLAEWRLVRGHTKWTLLQCSCEWLCIILFLFFSCLPEAPFAGVWSSLLRSKELSFSCSFAVVFGSFQSVVYSSPPRCLRRPFNKASLPPPTLCSTPNQCSPACI